MSGFFLTSMSEKKPEGEVVVFRHYDLVYKWKKLPV